MELEYHIERIKEFGKRLDASKSGRTKFKRFENNLLYCVIWLRTKQNDLNVILCIIDMVNHASWLPNFNILAVWPKILGDLIYNFHQ